MLCIFLRAETLKLIQRLPWGPLEEVPGHLPQAAGPHGAPRALPKAVLTKKLLPREGFQPSTRASWGPAMAGVTPHTQRGQASGKHKTPKCQRDNPDQAYILFILKPKQRKSEGRYSSKQDPRAREEEGGGETQGSCSFQRQQRQQLSGLGSESKLTAHHETGRVPSALRGSGQASSLEILVQGTQCQRGDHKSQTGTRAQQHPGRPACLLPSEAPGHQTAAQL